MDVNWPYPSDQVLIPAEQEAVKINPIFESHIRQLSNWSLGASFQATFPGLVDESVRIQDRSPVQPQ